MAQYINLNGPGFFIFILVFVTWLWTWQKRQLRRVDGYPARGYFKKYVESAIYELCTL